MGRTVIIAAARLIGRVIARPAAVTPPPAMQRKAIRRSVIAIRAVLAVAALGVLRSLLRLRLAAGDE